MFSDTFSEQDLVTLREFTQSSSYRQFVAQGEQYPRLAALYEVLNRPASDIADAYLQASWNDVFHRLERGYLRKAVASYQRALKEKALSDQQRQRYLYLLVELNRRTRQFHAATQVLRQLIGRPGLQPIGGDHDGLDVWARLLGLQAYPITKKDDQPHRRNNSFPGFKEPEDPTDPGRGIVRFSAWRE